MIAGRQPKQIRKRRKPMINSAPIYALARELEWRGEMNQAELAVLARDHMRRRGVVRHSSSSALAACGRQARWPDREQRFGLFNFSEGK
jgi:hypothetical protein